MCQQGSVVMAARPRIWYDMRQLVGADGAACATLVDRSGHAHNATQATGAKQPIIKRNVTGGTVLRFDGVNDCLQSAAINLSNTQAITALIVLSINTCVGMLYETSTDGGANAGAFGAYTGAGGIKGFNPWCTGNVGVSDRTGTATFTGWHCLGQICDFTLPDPETAVYADEAVTGSNPNVTSNNTGSFSAAFGLNIGSRNNGASLPFSGDIAQLVIFDRKLTVADYNAVSKALRAMCGV